MNTRNTLSKMPSMKWLRITNLRPDPKVDFIPDIDCCTSDNIGVGDVIVYMPNLFHNKRVNKTWKITEIKNESVLCSLVGAENWTQINNKGLYYYLKEETLIEKFPEYFI